MKSAFLLTGKIGGLEGKDGKGKLIDYRKCCQAFKEHIISVNNCDVFIHSWSVEQEVELRELYQPVICKFEPQINFSANRKENRRPLKGEIWRAKSRWYSIKQVMKLKQLREWCLGFQYDWVIITRFDLLMLQPINFRKLSPEKIHIPNLSYWPKENSIQKHLKPRPFWKIPPKNNLSETKPWLHDFFIISTSEIADKLATIERTKWSSNPHKGFWKQINRCFGNPREVVNFIGHRGHEFDLYRWWLCNQKKGKRKC